MSYIEILRKFGAEHMLTAEERKFISGIQLTAEDEQPLRIDIRFNSCVRSIIEVNGVWVLR